MKEKLNVTFYDVSPITVESTVSNWLLKQSFFESFIDNYDTIFQNHFKISQLVNRDSVINQVKIADIIAPLSRYVIIKVPSEVWGRKIDKSTFVSEFIQMFQERFPQLVIHEIWEKDSSHFFQIGVGFVPVVIRTSSNPVQYGLKDSLRQQLSWSPNDAEDLTSIWLENVYTLSVRILERFFSRQASNEHLTTETSLSDDNLTGLKITESTNLNASFLSKKINDLANENNRKNEQIRLCQNKIDEYTTEINELRTHIEDTASIREKRIKNKLTREKQTNHSLTLLGEKLKERNKRLKKQLMLIEMNILDDSNNRSEDSQNWYQKKVIDISLYDALMNKVTLLDKSWKLNLKLNKKINRLGISEELNNNSRWLLTHQLSEEIQLFLSRNEALSISERVKIRRSFFLIKGNVTLLQGDYDNLVEKAVIFDILNNENYFLETLLSAYNDNLL